MSLGDSATNHSLSNEKACDALKYSKGLAQKKARSQVSVEVHRISLGGCSWRGDTTTALRCPISLSETAVFSASADYKDDKISVDRESPVVGGRRSATILKSLTSFIVVMAPHKGDTKAGRSGELQILAIRLRFGNPSAIWQSVCNLAIRLQFGGWRSETDRHSL
ncbi:uncharacterized protein MEPE_03895 [Melanopsichium pennsylvanicum]|uniref:Uncharacterized protein n=1 Tax=Melanopsichium pennsylvanicum TaxID=63383 RepID=A0AAJ5C5X3_9BASI|nr:uncharacterized protein MEPE_03895 [Melanopsichium pennsylvanicum]